MTRVNECTIGCFLLNPILLNSSCIFINMRAFQAYYIYINTCIIILLIDILLINEFDMFV